MLFRSIVDGVPLMKDVQLVKQTLDKDLSTGTFAADSGAISWTQAKAYLWDLKSVRSLVRSAVYNKP